MTPWRRCQPGSGDTRAEPVFPTKREGPARGRSRHAMVAEALVPPDATRVATVYTNAPKRHREAILANLCTLLRPHRLLARSSRRNSVHKCPKTAPRGRFRRSVYTIASSHLSTTAQQPNSVHKCPKTARRGPILPFVYTIAIPRPPTTQAHGTTVYTNAPKRLREVISTDLCTLLRRRPSGEAHVARAVTQPPTHTNSRSFPFLAGLQHSLICLRE